MIKQATYLHEAEHDSTDDSSVFPSQCLGGNCGGKLKKDQTNSLLIVGAIIKKVEN